MASVEVSTQMFENSHGRAPRGRGMWIFSFGYDREDDESSWDTFNGTYGEAKKQAVKAAKEKGVDYIVVMP